MRLLAREITLAIVSEYGPGEMLVRLSDPTWFQAFGCVLGFDWHSSGVTTTVCGALKDGLRGLEHESGLVIAGGKGGVSRKTQGPAAVHSRSQTRLKLTRCLLVGGTQPQAGPARLKGLRARGTARSATGGLGWQSIVTP